jgi:hypothetical protein
MTLSLLLMAAAVSVDFTAETGRIRPELHSSGFGPQICSCPQENIEAIKSMRLKAARTHDWALINPGQRVCDYFNIFPLMHLDATIPENYVFGPTDYLLKLTREETGLDIFFRLGSSIEHSGAKVHFNTQIPDDFDKVAEIFAGTIRHYNRGWADGHRWNIKYWEIWNEPDNQNCMWCLEDGDGGKGDTAKERFADLMEREKKRRELFVRFFVTCLKRIKSEFPDVKVGGPALCTWRDDAEPDFAAHGADAPSAWTRKYRNTSRYFREILAACKAEGVAPDFISWHYYGSNPDDVLAAIEKGRRLCDEMGFPDCELILNEWHYRGCPWGEIGSSDPEVRRCVWEGPASHNGIDSSCFNLTLMSRFQSSPLDQSYYYGCRSTGTWGFMDENRAKYKVFYGLKLYGEFVNGYQLMCPSKGAKGVTVLAAKTADGGTGGFIVTDYRAKTKEIAVDVKGVADGEVEAWVHDYTRNFEKIPARIENGRLVLKKLDTHSAAFYVRCAVPKPGR